MGEENTVALVFGWAVVSTGLFLCIGGLSQFFEARAKPWGFSEWLGCSVASAIWCAPGCVILYMALFKSDAVWIYRFWFIVILAAVLYRKRTK